MSYAFLTMKVYLEVYGCTANKSDADLVKSILKKEEHVFVSDMLDADVLVILTCTVISTTEHRMLSRLKLFKKTGKKIVVSGCMASVQSDLIKSVVPNAILIPPQDICKTNSILFQKEQNIIFRNKTSFSKIYDDVIAPVMISEGCMFSCSYCITSIARGKLKSFPMNEIVENIESAVNQGCKEIQLTAQDTASYGLDTETNLGFLLNTVKEIMGSYKIRIGMMNPFTLKKNIASILNGFDNHNVYKFLHLPVQSGDNDVLKLMNRKYTVEDFYEILEKFRKKYPDLTFSTDVILGFPTETDEQFQHTVNMLKTVKPDITNITRFSARPFTKAKKMKGRIPTETVKKRSRLLTKVCSDISHHKNQESIGKKYNVLIIEEGKHGTFIGRNDNYKPVILKEKVKIGDVKTVEITDAESTYLVGSII